jgi:hypothetical protein
MAGQVELEIVEFEQVASDPLLQRLACAKVSLGWMCMRPLGFTHSGLG